MTRPQLPLAGLALPETVTVTMSPVSCFATCRSADASAVATRKEPDLARRLKPGDFEEALKPADAAHPTATW